MVLRTSGDVMFFGPCNERRFRDYLDELLRLLLASKLP